MYLTDKFVTRFLLDCFGFIEVRENRNTRCALRRKISLSRIERDRFAGFASDSDRFRNSDIYVSVLETTCNIVGRT